MRADRFNIRHLAAVAAVAEGGSIAVAARAVNLTQPAITQGVAKLERQLGVALFERRPDGMVPTEAARRLSVRAQAALRFIGSRSVTAAQLRAFVALATGGSYPAAAAATGLAEASLHRAVVDLSLVLGQRLVERRGRGLSLTRRGAEVARGFRLALAELRSAVAEIDSLKGTEAGRLALGAMPLSRARLLPETVSAFYRLYPEVDLSITEGSYAELVGPLRNGEIDLMIGALRATSASTDLQQTPLFADRPVIIGRQGHPLTGRARYTAADLADYHWIVPPEGTPLRALWRQMFDAAGVPPPRVPIESGSVITIRQILLQSDLLTLLSPDQLSVELEAGWLLDLGQAPADLSRIIGVTVRMDWRPTPLQARFIDMLTEQGRAIAGAAQNS